MIKKILAVQILITALISAFVLGQWFAHDLPNNIALLCAIVLVASLASLQKIVRVTYVN